MTRATREAALRLRAVLSAPGVSGIPDGMGAFSVNDPNETIMVTYGDMRAICSALEEVERHIIEIAKVLDIVTRCTEHMGDQNAARATGKE